MARLAADRLEIAKSCRSVLSLSQAARLRIADRLAFGDSVVAYDIVAELREQMDALLTPLAVAMTGDGDALARLRELEQLKPHYGTEPVIRGVREAGDIVSQETAGTDASGTEQRRTAAADGTSPRAMAGQRAGGRRC